MLSEKSQLENKYIADPLYITIIIYMINITGKCEQVDIFCKIRSSALLILSTELIYCS